MPDIRIGLAAARINAKLTQAEVASKMHVCKQTILNWEKGRTGPSVSQARQLSELYGLPQDLIFFPDKSN